jgi:hypothetical protein
MKKKDLYLDIVCRLLNKKKVCLGRDLATCVAEKCGILQSDARVYIRRLVESKKIFCSSPLRFAGGFAYSKNKSNNIYRGIVQKEKPMLYAVLNKFEENGFIISKTDICKLSACILTENDKYYTYEKVLKDMEYFYQIKKELIEGNEFIIDQKSLNNYQSKYNELYKRNFVDCSIIPTIINYLKSMNLLQKKDVPHYRNKNNPFRHEKINNLVFDASGFTVTTGFVEFEKNGEKIIPQKTLVIFDVKVSEIYTNFDYNGFEKRINCLIFATKGKTKRKILPIIVCNEINDKLIEEVVSDKKCLILQVKKIFGKIGIETINFIMRDSKSLGNKDFSELLDKLEVSGLETFNFIKGYIFELIVERILDKIFVSKNVTLKNNLEINCANDNGETERAELDIVVMENATGKKIVFECKSSALPIRWRNIDSQNNDSSYAKYFFNTTAGKLDKKYGKNEYYMCMISANGFDGETIKKSVDTCLTNRKHPNFKLLYSVKELIDTFKEEIENLGDNINKEKEILEKYFISE